MTDLVSGQIFILSVSLLRLQYCSMGLFTVLLIEAVRPGDRGHLSKSYWKTFSAPCHYFFFHFGFEGLPYQSPS